MHAIVSQKMVLCLCWVNMSACKASVEGSFCQWVRRCLLRLEGIIWVTESSVETTVMVEGEDDVGRGGTCWGCCQTVCYRIHDTDRRTSVDLLEWLATLTMMDEHLLSVAGTHKAPPRKRAIHRLRDDDCPIDRLDDCVSHAVCMQNFQGILCLGTQRDHIVHVIPPLTSCWWK